jgi:sugar lactone lactonase YvrE
MLELLMRNRGFTALLLLLVLSIAASAVTPQFWENFTQADLLEGSLDRMSLTSEGRLYLSPAYDSVFDTGQPYIFSMVRDKRGNIYVGTGDDGRVFRIDPQGKGALFFKSDEINIFAMAVDASDRLYVGTSPDGKVYKVTGPNQATEFFDSEDKYIWSMIFDDENNLYIGTGGGGTIYKVDDHGGKTVFYQCGDSHVMCLARNGKGNLLAGTSPSGLVIEINSEGKGFTLLDTPMEEVHSLAFDRFGVIYAVASSAARIGAKPASRSDIANGKTDMASAASMLIESIVGPQKPKTERSMVSAPGGGASSENRSVVYAVSGDGSAETVYASQVQMVFDAVVRSDGSLLLATGPRGRLLSIDAAKQVSVVSDTSEEQLTRLLADGDTVYSGGSNQGGVYRLHPERAQRGVFESQILDAETVASWGKIFWHVTNPRESRFEFFTRTGNTEKIDNSWSDWSSSHAGSGQQISSPKARYLQWRVSVKGGSSPVQEPLSDLLDRIQISYLQQNLRPQVVEIEVLPYGIEFQRQPSLTLSGASYTTPATTPDGRSLNAPRERERNAPVPAPRQVLQPGAQSFAWKAMDENQDSLEYSLYFKGESESDWKLLEEKYSDAFYTLYAASLPDGIYRLKVAASDAPSNPYDKFLISELVSQPFAIANMSPQVKITDSDVTGNKVEMAFDAQVFMGSVATSEFSIDGGDWHLVFPVDGIADSEREEYRITTPNLTIGEHLISIRTGDRDGNTGMAKAIVKIP